MHKDWKQVAKELSGLMAETRRGIPEVGKAFQQLAAAARVHKTPSRNHAGHAQDR